MAGLRGDSTELGSPGPQEQGEQRTHDEVHARPQISDSLADEPHRDDGADLPVGHEGWVVGDAPAALGADQFKIFISPSGRVLYEFGSKAVAEKFFGSRIVANREDLRAVIGELMADAPVRKSGGGSKGKTGPVDRNLVTTREFAEFLNCAESSVFEMLKLGLPSIKSPKLGRRILKAEAEAWLLAGGATRSRTAKRLRKTSGAGRSG